MSTSTCRGCGRPVGGELRICSNCGVRTTVESAAAPVQTAPLHPVGTATIPRAVEARAEPTPRESYTVASLTRLVVISAVVGLIVALAAAYFWPTRSDLVAMFPMDADGGRIALADGTTLEFPDGSLPWSHDIGVHKRILGSVVEYTFTPTTLVFARPVAVTFGASIRADGMRVRMVDGGDVRDVAVPNDGAATVLAGGVTGGHLMLAESSS